PGAVALPEPDGRGERAGLPSIRPRLRLAATGGTAHPRQARRDFPRPRRRRGRSRAGSFDRSAADGRGRTGVHGLGRVGAPRHPRRADVVARRPHRGPAARLRAALGRRGLELRADLAHSRRGALDLRPHRRHAGRQGGGGRPLAQSQPFEAGRRDGRRRGRSPAFRRGARRRGRGSADPGAHVSGTADGRPRARCARGRDRGPRRTRRPRPDRASPPGFRRRLAPAIRRRRQGTGRPRRRRPGFGRRLSAMVDSAEHRRSIAPAAARRPAHLAAPRGGTREFLAPADQDSHARRRSEALFARALASDARVVLMDDPMRGVDYGTKIEVYELIRAEAASGRTFLWYTTETKELKNCDRIYVFRNGAVVAELTRDELTEERVIQSSFAGAA